jgi:hypothetical protein
LPLFYPPKWEINERMPDEADLSPRQLAPALSG